MRVPASRRLAWCLLVALAALAAACIGSAVSCVDVGGPAPAALLADPAQPWPRHTITAAYQGADGHVLFDANGDGLLDVGAAWEESSKVTVSLNPGSLAAPWPTTAIATHSSAEDVTACDLDGDGKPDVISVGEDKKARVMFGAGAGAFAAPVVIAAITGLQQLMQVACGDVDGNGAPLELVVGGRVATAPGTPQIYVLRSATPRTGSSWSRQVVGPAGWTMSLVLVPDASGQIDIVASDRLQAAPAVNGVRRWHRTGSSWSSVVLLPVLASYLPRFVDVGPGGGLLVGSVRSSDQTSTLLLDGQAVPYPAALGVYQAGRAVDLDGDDRLDLVLTSGVLDVAPPAAWSGVVALLADGAGGWTRQEISGAPGTKFDEVDAVDLDGDGDLDVVTTEQNDGLGVVVYEQQ